jgi:hypothetical protein
VRVQEKLATDGVEGPDEAEEAVVRCESVLGGGRERGCQQVASLQGKADNNGDILVRSLSINVARNSARAAVNVPVTDRASGLDCSRGDTRRAAAIRAGGLGDAIRTSILEPQA